MKLLWTRSGTPLSVFIRKGLNEPCSHFLIDFDGLNEVFQSNLLGTGLEYDKTFFSHCEVVHQIDVVISQENKAEVRFSILSEFDGKTYDFGAFAYFIYRAFLNRFFKVPYPEKNAWQSDNSFLCVGLAKALDIDGVPEWLRECVRDLKDSEMVSPERLFQIIQAAYERSTQTAS